MTEFHDHTQLPGGFRIRPDGHGGVSFIKVGNETLRAIPARERLLEVVCHAAGSRSGPRLVAVVTFDWQLHVVANPEAEEEPGRLLTRCRCGPEGHSLSLARIVQQVDLLASRPQKARRVDVQAVT